MEIKEINVTTKGELKRLLEDDSITITSIIEYSIGLVNIVYHECNEDEYRNYLDEKYNADHESMMESIRKSLTIDMNGDRRPSIWIDYAVPVGLAIAAGLALWKVVDLLLLL